MDLVKVRPELQETPDHRPLIAATAGQINKDFSTFGKDIFKFVIPSTWDELFDQLRPVIHLMVKNEEHKLVQIFYRIDLSENLLRQTLAASPFEEAVDQISVLIIRRELKKVLYRIRYSSNTKEPE